MSYVRRTFCHKCNNPNYMPSTIMIGGSKRSVMPDFRKLGCMGGPSSCAAGGGGSGKDGDDLEHQQTRDRDEGANSAALLKTIGSRTEDIVILDVTGMRCAGCVSRVKNILEEQECVISASVNLATETAVVKVIIPEALLSGNIGADLEMGNGEKETETDEGNGDYSNALQQLGQQLASLLSEKGYTAKIRPLGSGTGAASKVVQAKREERMRRLKEATVQVIVAWGLASTCMLHHIVHWFGAAAPRWIQMLASTPGTAVLSALALLGPGRQIVVDGFKAMKEGAPDMNSLVGLGATAAFAISSIALFIPRLGWRTFFEEPAMLLGFVLVGRALEERAKIQASADMAALTGLLPPVARVFLSDGVSWREIPSENVAKGDLVTVLPGDRVPVDGEVLSGRSTVDESSITGESLPVDKQNGMSLCHSTKHNSTPN